MDQLLFLGYELSTTLIPFLIVFILFRRHTKQKGIPASSRRNMLTLVFALYMIAVFHVTGAGTLYDGLLYRLEFRPEEINFVPFSNGLDITSYLNLLLFLPFGLLVPLIWPDLNHPLPVVGSGFACSLLIELSQLLNRRRTDIDDLILNTIGALIGYAVFSLLSRLVKQRSGPCAASDWSLLVYILTIFLGRFFLFHDMGLAKLLYGF